MLKATGTTCSGRATMPLLTMMVRIAAFGAEVAWLLAEPPAS
jgi:hypothetical protein